MAIDYKTQGEIKDNAVYQSRCLQAAQKAALDIVGESQGASTAEEWAARQEYGHQVLAGNSARKFFGPVLANLGVASSATDETGIADADLKTAVEAVWNDLAGISAV